MERLERRQAQNQYRVELEAQLRAKEDKKRMEKEMSMQVRMHGEGAAHAGKGAWRRGCPCR